MKLSIEELANKFNELSDNNPLEYKTSDKRVRNDISVRRIRSYITKGLLDKPLKEGNKSYFTEEHLNKLISLRQYASSGLSDTSLLNISLINTQLNSSLSNENQETSTLDFNLRNNAFNTLDEIKSKSQSANNLQSPQNLFFSSVSTSLAKTTRSWQEHQLDKEGKVFVKQELGTVFSEEEKIELINNLKKFLYMEN